jgi:hypothetical protein
MSYGRAFILARSMAARLAWASLGCWFAWRSRFSLIIQLVLIHVLAFGSIAVAITPYLLGLAHYPVLVYSVYLLAGVLLLIASLMACALLDALIVLTPFSIAPSHSILYELFAPGRPAPVPLREWAIAAGWHFPARPGLLEKWVLKKTASPAAMARWSVWRLQAIAPAPSSFTPSRL